MAQTLKDKEPLPEVKKVPTDHENINLTRDEFIAKRRKAKELEARLKAAAVQIEKDLEAEGAKDEKSGDAGDIQTLKDVKPGRKAKAKE